MMRTGRVKAPAGLSADVVVLGLIWGASVVLQRVAVAEIPPLAVVTLRLAAALLFFCPLAPSVLRGLAAQGRLLPHVLLIGVLNPALSALFTVLALQHASSGLVAVLASLAPLLAALLGYVLPGASPERLTRLRLSGLTAAFVGVAVLILTGHSGLDEGWEWGLRGQLLALCVALVLALSGVYASRCIGDSPPMPVAAGEVLGGLVFIIPLSLLTTTSFDPVKVSPSAWWAVILSGSIGLGASFILLAKMLRQHGPTGALLAVNVTPLAAAGLGVLLLGETLTPQLLTGAALVLSGIYLFSLD